MFVHTLPYKKNQQCQLTTMLVFCILLKQRLCLCLNCRHKTIFAEYFDVLSSYRNTKLCIISIRTKRFSNLFSKIVSHKTRISANEPVTRKKIHPKNSIYKLQPGSDLVDYIFSNLHLCFQLIDSLISRFIQNCHLIRIYAKSPLPYHSNYSRRSYPNSFAAS